MSMKELEDLIKVYEERIKEQHREIILEHDGEDGATEYLDIYTKADLRQAAIDSIHFDLEYV